MSADLTPYVVKVFDVETPPLGHEEGYLIADVLYLKYDTALQAAVAYADKLCADMIEADALDGAGDREWKVEYHDDGANVFEDGQLAWRVEVVGLTVQ